MAWRFNKYTDFPFLWARWQHPALAAESQQEVLDSFYSLKPCCRNRDFSTKLFQHCPTAAQLSADDAMKKLLYTFAREYRFTDMWSERLLARILKASDGKECYIERVYSSGFCDAVRHRTFANGSR